jgi:hypothetical protein
MVKVPWGVRSLGTNMCCCDRLFWILLWRGVRVYSCGLVSWMAGGGVLVCESSGGLLCWFEGVRTILSFVVETVLYDPSGRWRQDAFWKVSGVSDIPVPQGRGHLRFRSHWKESQEKPTPDKNRARTKTAFPKCRRCQKHRWPVRPRQPER